MSSDTTDLVKYPSTARQSPVNLFDLRDHSAVWGVYSMLKKSTSQARGKRPACCILASVSFLPRTRNLSTRLPSQNHYSAVIESSPFLLFFLFSSLGFLVDSHMRLEGLIFLDLIPPAFVFFASISPVHSMHLTLKYLPASVRNHTPSLVRGGRTQL